MYRDGVLLQKTICTASKCYTIRRDDVHVNVLCKNDVKILSIFDRITKEELCSKQLVVSKKNKL